MQGEVDRLSRKCVVLRNTLEAKQAKIERLTRDLAECRRLLREAIGWCERTHVREVQGWAEAARKAAGGE